MKIVKAIRSTCASYPRVALLLAGLFLISFYLYNSPLSEPYSSVTFSKSFQEDVYLDQNELSKLLLDYTRLSNQTYPKKLILEYFQNLKLSKSNGSLVMFVNKINSDVVENIYNSQMDQVLAIDEGNRKTKTGQAKSQLIKKIDLKKKDLAKLEANIRRLKQDLVKNQIATQLKNLQALSLSLGKKHPQMEELYTNIASKYLELGLEKPKYQDLLQQSVNEITTPGLSQEQYQEDEQLVAEERKKLLNLERKLHLIDSNFQNIDVPQINHYRTSWYGSLLLKVIIPALLQLLLVFAVWTFVIYRSGKVVNNQHLAEQVEDIPIYTIGNAQLDSSITDTVPKKAIAYQSELSSDEELQVTTEKSLVKVKQKLPALVEKISDTSFEMDDLVTNLLSKASEKNQKIFVCTSASDELANVQLMINFATALAKFSPKVLLVDAAFNANSVSKHFDMSDSLGLSDYITRKAKIAETLHTTNITNLSVLPIGTQKDVASKLLYQPRFDIALKSFINRYDFLLVATGALDNDPTAKIVAKKLQGVYLVANQQTNTLAVIKEALLKLQDLDVQADGVIFQTTV